MQAAMMPHLHIAADELLQNLEGLLEQRVLQLRQAQLQVPPLHGHIILDAAWKTLISKVRCMATRAHSPQFQDCWQSICFSQTMRHSGGHVQQLLHTHHHVKQCRYCKGKRQTLTFRGNMRHARPTKSKAAALPCGLDAYQQLSPVLFEPCTFTAGCAVIADLGHTHHAISCICN